MSGPFSRVYCVPDSPRLDSERFRHRIAVYIDKIDADHEIAGRIEMECGVSVPWLGTGRNWKRFFKDAELRDVLDSLTHVHAVLVNRQKNSYGVIHPREWIHFVSRALAEEHTSYVVDDSCHVRFAVDEQYASNRAATLAGLQVEKWSASRAEFERAFAAMDKQPQDTNGSIRAIAASVESCAKVIAGPGMARLGPSEIQRFLRPKIDVAYASDETAQNAAGLMLKSLAEWTNATHQYRHGQQSECEVSAPAALTIQFLTAGAGFIRWLIDIDGK